MRERIPLQAVGTALEQEELRLEPPQMRQHPRPGDRKRFVTVTWGKRDVEFGALCLAAAGFVCRARARIKVAAILVDVGEDQIRIVFVGVEHAVAVMHVDVDIGDALNAVFTSQRVDYHPQVVEYAETRRTVSPRVV